ncbi:hypothetical protein HK105_202909 [Polyrhizophydium stewartii]|uniref:Uncharacterized protein n=1 Tax=Polyrhizophydium stewartii TaxID=2732419 RepID=A0ABR4NDL0_9FUNG
MSSGLASDTDIYRLFSSLYGITIADACFQPPRSNVEDELVAIGPVAKGCSHRKMIGMLDIDPILYATRARLDQPIEQFALAAEL